MSRATQQARITQREAAAANRRRRLTAGAGVVAVVLVISAMVIAKASSSSSRHVTSAPAAAVAPTSLTSALAAVPASVFTAVGAGSAAPPTAASGGALTSGGKPHVVFVGDEWCPYCAAERWGLVVALSRFGTFTGLGETSSSASDVYPRTATLSFHGASYTSPYLSFDGYELQDGSHKALDSLPADIASVVSAQSSGAVPFIDLGGTKVINGASYDPAVLKGKTQTQIAAALTDASSPIAKAIVGTANQITKQLCTLTGNQPAAVCAA